MKQKRRASKPADRATGPIRIRVFIVDDHQLTSHGLGVLLSRQPDIVVVGYATSVADVVAVGRVAQPDVAVVDFHLPDGTGVDAASAIRRLYPNVRVVFISWDESEAAWRAAIEAGAGAFVNKTSAPIELIDAVRRVAGGAALMPPMSIANLLRRNDPHVQVKR